MHSIEQEIQRLSFTRCSLDFDRCFSALSVIPSSSIQNMCRYVSVFTTEERSSLMKGIYAKLTGRNDTAHAADLATLLQFEHAQADQSCKWEFLPVGARRTLQIILQRTGKIPTQLLCPANGITVESVRTSAPARLPSEKQLKAYLRREFKATTAWKEPGGGTSFCISEIGTQVRFKTLIGCSNGGRVICCFHQYSATNGDVHQFCLFPYGVTTGALIFDMVEADSLERLTVPLRRLVSDVADFVGKFDVDTLSS